MSPRNVECSVHIHTYGMFWIVKAHGSLQTLHQYWLCSVNSIGINYSFQCPRTPKQNFRVLRMKNEQSQALKNRGYRVSHHSFVLILLRNNAIYYFNFCYTAAMILRKTTLQKKNEGLIVTRAKIFWAIKSKLSTHWKNNFRKLTHVRKDSWRKWNST